MRYQLFLLLILISLTKLAFAQGDKISVPVAGNYYALDQKNPDAGYKVYVRLAKKGEMSIALDVKDKAKGNIQICRKRHCFKFCLQTLRVKQVVLTN